MRGHVEGDFRGESDGETSVGFIKTNTAKLKYARRQNIGEQQKANLSPQAVKTLQYLSLYAD